MDDEVLLSVPRNYVDFAYRPKRRTPLKSYMRRLSLQYIYPDNTVLDRETMDKVYNISVLFVSKHERSINLTTFGKIKLSKSTQTFINSSSGHNQNQNKKRFFYLLFLIILAVIIIYCSIIIGVSTNCTCNGKK